MTWHVKRTARFIGRGRSLAAPAAMEVNSKLSGTTGAVLDPIFSLRGRIAIGPDESTHLAFSTAFADSREQAVQLADQYRDPRVVQRTFEMAWAHSQVELRHLHVSGASVQLYQRLASAVLFPDASLRAPFDVLKSNRRASDRCGGTASLAMIRLCWCGLPVGALGTCAEVLMAHEFWNTHGLKVDVVIVNEHPAGYFDEFQDQLQALIQSTTRLPMHKSGGVYLLRAAQLTPEDIVLLQAVSSINLRGNSGSLARQVDAGPTASQSRVPELRLMTSAVAPTTAIASSESEPVLEFANGVGGFNGDGDYVIRLRAGQSTPLPWSNVIANDRFGFLVTESGGGYTWAGNSRENKLTSGPTTPSQTCRAKSSICATKRRAKFGRRLRFRDATMPSIGCATAAAGRGLPIRPRNSFRANDVDCDECVRQIRLLEASQRQPESANAIGNLLCGMGFRCHAAADAYARLHRAGQRKQSDPCPQLLSRRFSGPGHFLARAWRGRLGHGRSHGVPRPKWQRVDSGRVNATAAFRDDGSWPRSGRHGAKADHVAARPRS